MVYVSYWAYSKIHSLFLFILFFCPRWLSLSHYFSCFIVLYQANSFKILSLLPFFPPPTFSWSVNLLKYITKSLWNFSPVHHLYSNILDRHFIISFLGYYIRLVLLVRSLSLFSLSSMLTQGSLTKTKIELLSRLKPVCEPPFPKHKPNSWISHACPCISWPFYTSASIFSNSHMLPMLNPLTQET